MNSIGELLGKEIVTRIAAEYVKIGSVYKMPMTEANGIIVPEGKTFHPKFFIVLGYDNEGNIYGGVIINSEINRNIPKKLQDLHRVILRSDYPFLDYDSYVDCSSIMIADPSTFSKWKYCGVIEEDFRVMIVETAKNSKVISRSRLRQFGIIQ